MQITDVRVRRIEKEGKMKAIVSITLDNEFVIHDIKVIEGEKGLFIAMPSRKAADGEYRDIAHPINSETRDMIQRVILNKYETTALENEEAADLPVEEGIISNTEESSEGAEAETSESTEATEPQTYPDEEYVPMYEEGDSGIPANLPGQPESESAPQESLTEAETATSEEVS